MSQETRKVLEMLAAGQITADDAEKLLEKLGAAASRPAAPGANEATAGPEGQSVHERLGEIGDQVRERVGNVAEGKSGQTRVWGWRIPARDEAPAPGQKLRFLRVVVDSPGHDQVNIRVPLAFVRAGMKLMGVIPAQVSEKLAEKGIDLAALRDLKGGELVDELKDLHVDVDTENGEKVRVYCE